MDDKADHRQSLLQTLHLDRVFCNCSCSFASFLCVFYSLPSHRGSVILLKGLGSDRKPTVRNDEMLMSGNKSN